MALAFLLLQTGFTKGSGDFQFNHRWKMVERLMTLQWYIYDRRLPHGSNHKAVTDSKNSKETVVDTPQYNVRQGTNQMDRVNEMLLSHTHTLIIMQKIQSRHDSLFLHLLMLMSHLCHNCLQPTEQLLHWREIIRLISALLSLAVPPWLANVRAKKKKKKIQDCKAKASSPSWPRAEWPDACRPFSLSTPLKTSGR